MKTPLVKYMKDYRPPAYRVDRVNLSIDLRDTDTRIVSRLSVTRNPDIEGPKPPLILDGESLDLISVYLDDQPLAPSDYQVTDSALTVPRVPDSFELRTEVLIQPLNNAELSGLYKSGSLFCTQCEAEGFRKITYFPDRPDVMAVYTCTVTADRTTCPVLLANGNPVGRGDLTDGRHWVTWEDPFKKPCYLFALVAGDLYCVEDRFRTRSGREVILKIYVEHENRDKCAYAMESLKKAMKWDEEAFGREYDLDIFMIVAVSDFNMGAMENKGLNIFNAKYVLARPDTATDTDFWNIERVIAHEYFHNWTGNRVTLRNWFQLSLKEGLTVFRDQEFSADMTSRPVKRIADVRSLRSFQFPEDAGPMAHPVRPPSYIKMDNFYTATVYEKGAEVIRMIQTILGPAAFRRGMDLYFDRHDGQAVTLEEFISAMKDASGKDLGQFMRWYSQAGTPVVTVNRRHDPVRKTYSLTFTQSCPPTPDMAEKTALHIPIAVGLLDASGKDIPLVLSGETGPSASTRVLHLRQFTETFTFEGIDREPAPSLLRHFSAPVKLRAGLSDDETIFLFGSDPDPFNRWDAGQTLFSRLLLRMIHAVETGAILSVSLPVIEAFRKTLLDPDLDKSFIALALTLPSELELAILMSETALINPEAIHRARQFVTQTLAETLKNDFQNIFRENQDRGPYSVDPLSVGRRSLKNLAMTYLGRIDTPDIPRFVFQQFSEARNMTDEMAALAVLSHIPGSDRTEAFTRFYEKWHSDTLVLDKWFALQSGAQIPDVLSNVMALCGHPAFSIKNPNKVRALIGSFCSSNPRGFHDPSGAGYRFIADRVLELDGFNPQIASYLARTFNHWKKYEPDRKALMKAELERISASPRLSQNVYEIVSRALAP